MAVAPADALIEEYRDYLVGERGLVAGSVVLRERTARLFLEGLDGPLDAALAVLSPTEVTRFVIRQCREARRSTAWAKTLTAGLRSLLVFLHVTGRVPVSLVDAVPSVAGWRLSTLPRSLDPADVASMLASCDRSTVGGRRNFAVLMLLSRLGLRACEVSAMRLDDIAWRSGELTVRGKGGQQDRLPLPRDVGVALAEYLRLRGAGSRGREVFARMLAPSGPLSPKAVGAIVGAACDRAGLPRVGTHRLRHTVATELLRAGTPLVEIAPVLRHTSVSSTAIYAKVDRHALRTLTRPWPVSGAAA